jgi:hypothetical protein
VGDGRDGGTRREGDGRDSGTRRETTGARGDGAGTRREGRNGGTRREEGAGPRPASGSGFTRGLPPELAARFEVAEELAAGAEADVVLVDDRASGRRLVLKLYRREVIPDEEAVGRLAAADRGHVVEITDRGWAGGCWFEVLEYCRFGSLRTLMTSRQVPALIDVIRQAGPALAHIHGIGIVHRDLKPENILIRTLAPLDAVLGDFGIARALDTSVRWTRQWGTPAYSPPEFEAGEVSAAWDWWSLGMIIAELAGGRHPFELPDGSMMNNQQIRSALAQRPVDLSAVADDRVRLLCQGLLTRDRARRWDHPQVTGWLAGRSPRVAADAPTASGRLRTVFFAGQNRASVADLAAALQQHWAEGIRGIYQERDATLVDEISRLLRQYQLEEAIRLLAPGGRAEEQPRRYAALLAELDPDLDPVYNGVSLVPAGLEAAAMEVLSSGGGHPVAPVLDEVRRLGILVSWRDLPGMAQGGVIQQRWTEANTDLETRISALASSGFRPEKTDWALARARLLLVALAPEEHGTQLKSLVAGLDRGDAERQQWWRELSSGPPTAASLTLAWLTRGLAARQASEQREAERTRRRAERDRQAAAEEERRRQRRAERDRRQAGRRSADRTWIVITLLVIATYLVPHLLGTALEKWRAQKRLPTWWTAHQARVTALPPPNPHALPTGAAFVPQWIFGGLVILAVLGVILLRPPWGGGRWPRLLAGFTLIAAAFFAPTAASKTISAYNQAGQTRYHDGPVPLSAFTATCDEYWTSDAPVAGTAYMRWVLTGPASGQCGALAAYVGWHLKWQHDLAVGHATWASLYMYGNVIVAEQDPLGHPNVLDAFDKATGRQLWVFSCGDGNDSYVSGTEYGATAITVTCARGQVTVNPRTGKAR